jgi:hypothetical protein
VIVATRPAGAGGELHGGAGHWRDILRGGTQRLESPTPISALLGERGVAVLERA